uniref:Class II aldolase/adducin N-terminal domain-containing protein n=1 Tax=candidate division WOR-3 bacterium TaxID=2052148 RepID=A0A7V0Z717_UNCW3
MSHLLIHSFFLKNKIDKKAIIHTHPNHIIALSHIRKYSSENAFNRLIWSIHPEVKVVIPEGVGYVKYNCPGTERLARATLKKLKNRRLIVWERHGCVAIGKDLYEAFDLIDTVNKAIEIFFICRNAGYYPQGLNSLQLKELEKNI